MVERQRWGFSIGSERKERYRPMFRLPKQEAEDQERLRLKILRKRLLEEY